MRADTRSRFRPPEELSLEYVRREIRIGSQFAAETFERAFDRFVQTYNVAPRLGRCSPDVLDRFCRLFEYAAEACFRREIRFRGVLLVAAVLPAGMVAFEGEVDEDRMGDW